jgi:hypothetical protein
LLFLNIWEENGVFIFESHGVLGEWPKASGFFFACKDEGPNFFKMYVTTNPDTQLHFPKDLNPVKTFLSGIMGEQIWRYFSV